MVCRIEGLEYSTDDREEQGGYEMAAISGHVKCSDILYCIDAEKALEAFCCMLQLLFVSTVADLYVESIGSY